MRTFCLNLTADVSLILLISLTCCLQVSGNSAHSEVPRCADRADGFYGEGCNGRYFGCANKITVYVRCPANLYFSEPTQKCDYMENVQACQKNNGTSRGPGTAEVSRHRDIESCKGRKNGAYSLESCSHKYLVCVHEVAWISACSGDLYFDARSKRCEMKAGLPACNMGSLSTAEVEELSTASGEMVCVGRPNGIIPLKCSPRYFVCSNGASFLLSCPGETVFDDRKLMCNYRSEVVSCTGISSTASPLPVGVPKTKSIPTKPSEITTAPTTTTTTGSVLSPVLGQTEGNFCIGKANGYYARERCSKRHYLCYGERTIDMVCSADLVFHGKACEFKHKVPDCKVTNAPLASAQPALAFPTSAPALPAQFVSKACLVNGERYATAPCASEYFECVNGVIIRKFCLAGETFDRISQQCTARNPFCDNSIDEIIFDGLPRTCAFGEVRSRGQCLVTYFECTEAGRFALSRCIEGYSFDPVFKKCRETELVIDCMPGVLPLEEASVLSVVEAPFSEPAVIPAREHVKDAFEIPIRALNPNTFFYGRNKAAAVPFYMSFNDASKYGGVTVGASLDGVKDFEEELEVDRVRRIKRGNEVADGSSLVQCAVLPDGSYGLSDGCNDKFVKCDNGDAVVMLCSAGLAYNTKTETCDFIYNVPACNAPRPPHDLLAAIREHVGDIPKETLVITKEGCKANGLFSLGCSRYFIVCAEGQPFVMTCPLELIFDYKQMKCLYHRLVRACSTEHKPKPTPTAAPENPLPMQVDCTGIDSGVFAPTCASYFVTCSKGKSIKTFCALGYQYDLTASRCVPARTCGKSVPSRKGSECEGVVKGFIAEKPCSREYLSCYKGFAQQMQCDQSLFFSNKEKKCVSYSECTNEEVASNAEETLGDYGFCVLRQDGKYRHPSDCRKIIVCVQGEDFEYPSCPDGLVFNEISSACDYIASVPECAMKTAPVPSLEKLCRGKPHGAFVKHGQCSPEYFRCIWEVPEKMHCPDNTAFNHKLSVCDYKENIAACRE